MENSHSQEGGTLSKGELSVRGNSQQGEFLHKGQEPVGAHWFLPLKRETQGGTLSKRKLSVRRTLSKGNSQQGEFLHRGQEPVGGRWNSQ